VNTSIPVSAILEDTGHCQNMSIVDTGRFWEILVIPVLQILEDSGKYFPYKNNNLTILRLIRRVRQFEKHD
jgi:hypothetical protein